jgi:hypothetical protein
VRALVSPTLRVISNMPRDVVIHALSIHLLFTISIRSFTIASSLTSVSPEEAITAPARMYNLGGAKVTAAPELKRQDATNYCTEWSIVNGNNFSVIVMNENKKCFRRTTWMLCAQYMFVQVDLDLRACILWNQRQ